MSDEMELAEVAFLFVAMLCYLVSGNAQNGVGRR